MLLAVQYAIIGIPAGGLSTFPGSRVEEQRAWIIAIALEYLVNQNSSNDVEATLMDSAK